MGDVEEGEIVEADIEMSSPRPLAHHRGTSPEIAQKNEGSRKFWTERRGIESFDYNHGRWMDRQMISARRQERYERSNVHEEQLKGRRVGLGEIKPKIAQDCNSGYFHRDERPKLDARLAAQHRFMRGQYFARRRRPTLNHRGGHALRGGYPRARFRNDSHQLAVNNLQGNDPWEPGHSQTSRHAVYDHRKVPQISSEEGGMCHNRDHSPNKHRVEDTFIERFERLDKSREEHLGLSEGSNLNEATIAAVNDNEDYNLDEYQLLLERHRLIQQQLSAIGVKERSLQDRMQKESLFGDSSDFEVIPNPNSPRDRMFTMQQYTEGGPDQHFGASSQIENHRSAEGNSYLGFRQAVYQYGNQPNIYGTWSNEPNEVYADSNVCTNTPKMPLHEVNNTHLESTSVPPPAAKSKTQKKRARRKRMKLKQSLRALTSSKPNASTDEHFLPATKNQNRFIGKALSGTKSSELNDRAEGYQSISMDIEEEYEEIDSFHDDDYHPVRTEEKQMDEKSVVSEPQLHVREPSELSANKDDSATELRQHAEIQQDETVTKNGSDDDMEADDDVEEDDLFLREQLLQSLATKRAEKARAIMADQYTNSSPPQPQYQTIATGQKEQSLQNQEINDILPDTQLSVIATSAPLYSSHVKSGRKDTDSANYFDRYSTTKGSEQHSKFVIQIGGESDSEDDSENEAPRVDGFFGGAINDLIREARHGAESQTETQPTASGVIKMDKKNDSDELDRKTLQLFISKAKRSLAITRSDIVEETNSIKLLQKKVNLRKTKIEQQDAKILKLRNLLSTAEKTKKGLSAQCDAFGAKIKLLVNQIKLRTGKNKVLEAELLQAKAVLSKFAAKSKTDLPNCLAGSPSTGSSQPGNSGDKMGSQSAALSVEQIHRRIVAMRSVLANHEKSMHAIQAKNKKPLRTNPTKTHTQPNKLSVASSKLVRQKSNKLQDERQRLQKLEEELRKRLDSMKKLSEAKEHLLEKRGPKQNLDTRKKLQNRTMTITLNNSPSKKPSYSIADNRIEDISRNINLDFTDAREVVVNNGSEANNGNGFGICERSNVGLGVLEDLAGNDNLNSADAKKTVSNSNNRTKIRKSFSINSHSDAGLVAENRIESKLNSLFQDKEKLKHIMQEQLDLEVNTLVLSEPHPHMIMDLAKKETGEREHETFDDIISPEGRARDHVKTTADLKFSDNFLAYSSPLLLFRSYRLSPWFRTKEKKSLKSGTYSHKINPISVVCPYDLTGKCLDDECDKQHASSTFALEDDQLLIDLIQYNANIASVTPKDSTESGDKKILNFISRLKQKYSNKIKSEELAVLLINDLRTFRRQKQKLKIFHVHFERRGQHLQPAEKSEKEILFKSQNRILERQRLKQGLSSERAESQELRYFEEHFNMKTSLEKSVNENPADIKSWLLLAEQIAFDSSHDENIRTISDREDKVLHVLSKALEANPHSQDLWIAYLDIFSKRKSPAESREMYIQALEYCRSYTIWWKCLELEIHYEDKMEICLDIMDYLRRDGSADFDQVLKSHRLLEVLLFTVKLAVMRGRQDLAVSSIQCVLGLPTDHAPFDLPVLIHEFTTGDAVVLWLCLISVFAFNQLPHLLFDMAVSGPSRIARKDIGMFAWSRVNENMLHGVRRLFENAVNSIDECKGQTVECTEMLAQLYANYIQLEIDTGRIENACTIATKCVNNLPVESVASQSMMSLLVIKTIVRNSSVLQHDVISKLNHLITLKTDECVYEYAKYLLDTNTPDHAIRLLVDTVTRKFNFTEDQEDASLEIGFKAEAISLYRRLLRCSTDLVVGSLYPKKAVEIDERSREYAFTWLNLCLLQELTGSVPDSDVYSTGAEEAFESAVNSYTTRENREILWLEYLAFRERQISKMHNKREGVKLYFDVVKRCLASMPASRPLPHQVSIYWNDYGFHNQVISKCLQFLPKSDEIEYLKGTFALMPTNVSLALRLCRALLIVGSFEGARTVYGIVLESNPQSLEMWKMAISVELKNKKIRETRWLYEEALRMVPYSDSLWKDFVLFEIGHCRDAGQIQTRIIEIATKATSYGMSIMDYVKSLLK